LRARRQELHARVATVLEQHFADLAERRPELLAHHLTGAGEVERAVAQWLKAGQFAAARLAHREAIRHFDRGLALLGSLPEDLARDGHETELLLGRGLSLFTTEGFSSTAAAQGYERASELAERRHDARQLFMAVYGQWQSSAGSGRLLAGSPLSQKLLNLTENQEDIGFRLQAHITAGGEPAGSPVNSRLAADIAKPGAGFMIRSGTAPTGCCLAATIPVFAPSTRPVKSSGCWAIPTQRWPAAERVWRWRSVSRTRSACYWS